MKDIFEQIKEYKNLYPQLGHASNILKKYEVGEKLDKLTLISDQYIKYLEGNIQLVGYTDAIIKKRVKLLNAYYNFIHFNQFDNLFTSQGKFRPTILEEFLYLLFKDYVTDYQTKFNAEEYLESGSVKAYSNLFIKASSFEQFVKDPDISVNEKDQDFAIFRKIDLLVNGDKTINLQVPAVAIEAKTFIDKTMLDGIIAAAEKVKSGNPHSLFVSVTETYDVSFNVDPAYSRIDEIYVLRKTTRKAPWADIAEDAVLELFNDIKTHLERPWSNVQEKMTKKGRIIK